MRIGTKILNIRKENNMTQNEFADLFGVTRQAVSNWENNKSYPDLEVIIKISDKFLISLEQLLKEDMVMVKHIDKNKKNINILKCALGLCTIIFLSGLTYILICKYQQTHMYDAVKKAGFKKELTEEFIERYQGDYALTEDGVDYRVQPKGIGKLELDTKKFFVFARKGEQDLTIRIDTSGDMFLALYPGDVQIDEKGSVVGNGKYTKEQQEKIKDILETRKAETTEIITKLLEKWRVVNELPEGYPVNSGHQNF